ncbi:MAG: hypothetical protein RLZZ292_2529 [Bacteroidota bacterium]|jgi:hypothetical protein
MYLFFISYNSGLMHNALYETFEEVYESIEQLITEEELPDKLLPGNDLQQYLSENDDFRLDFSNGTWCHLQMQPVFGTS